MMTAESFTKVFSGTCLKAIGFAGALLGATLGLSGGAMAEDGPARLNITVTGEAGATPDMATLSVGVVSEAETAAEAMAAQRESMAKVLNAALEAGFAESDLQTSGLSLNPRYSRAQTEDAPKIIGYSASNQVTARVLEITDTGARLDALVAAGANEINGVSFGLQDPAEMKEAARKDAVAKLYARKSFYEAEAKLKLGRVLEMTERSDRAGPAPMMERVQFGGGQTPIAPGELTITVDLSASFEIVK